MRVTARTMFFAGLGGGVVVAAVAAVALWLQAGPAPAPVVPTPPAFHAEAPAPSGTPEDLAVVTAELARVQAGNAALAQRTDTLQRELRALRARLTQVDQAQTALGQARVPSAAAAPAARPDAAPPTLPPADEQERVDAQAQAQVEVLEDTMRAEPPDPQWAPTAEAALRQALHGEAMGGLDLGAVACGTTLCRLELASTGPGSPADNLRNLAHLAPWPGPGFYRVDVEAGEAVLYLAREGYALPPAGH